MSATMDWLIGPRVPRNAPFTSLGGGRRIVYVNRL